jgi:hypothetical protein
VILTFVNLKKNDLNKFVIYRYTMSKTPEQKAKHAEYQQHYRERKMIEYGNEEYKLQEKKKAELRIVAKYNKIVQDQKELEEKMKAMKVADDIVDNLKVKRGRGRPKKA